MGEQIYIKQQTHCFYTSELDISMIVLEFLTYLFRHNRFHGYPVRMKLNRKSHFHAHL